MGNIVISRLGDLLARLITAAVIALMGIVVAVTFIQVIWRYVLNAALIWPEEIARYSFIWITFLGTTLLLRHGQLLAVDVLAAAAGPRLRSRLAIIVRLSTIPLLAVLTWEGVAMMRLVEGEVMSATRLPMAWLYLSAPVCGVVGLCFVLEGLLAGAPSEEPRP